MTQSAIRKRLRTLEAQQAKRVVAVQMTKRMLDRIVADKQREIDNMRAQITIGVLK